MNIESMIEVLNIISEICTDASLTGRYSNANKIIVTTYNELLEEVMPVLNDKTICKFTILNMLNEDANMDEVGFASKVLIMLLKDKKSLVLTKKKENN